MGSGECFLRQLSAGGGGGEGWGYPSYYSCAGSTKGSKRWGKSKDGGGGGWEQREEECGDSAEGNNNAAAAAARKRVMVVIDHSSGAKHAMMWALTHVANKGDLLTLLHVLPPPPAAAPRGDDTPHLATSLATLCKACKPEVEVEALVIQGPKLATVLSQVRKLEASVLVLSQTKPSPLSCLFRSRGEEFVERCIDGADCLTLAVRKRSRGVGGYLVSTRWQKNFWLLA